MNSDAEKDCRCGGEPHPHRYTEGVCKGPTRKFDVKAFSSFLRDLKKLLELEEQKRQTYIQLVRAMHGRLCKSRQESGEFIGLDKFEIERDAILAWLGLQPDKYYAWNAERKTKAQVEQWLNNMVEAYTNEE